MPIGLVSTVTVSHEFFIDDLQFRIHWNVAHSIITLATSCQRHKTERFQRKKRAPFSWQLGRADNYIATLLMLQITQEQF
jgi:hypothetical protein